MAEQRTRAANAAGDDETETTPEKEKVEEPTFSHERLIAEAGAFVGQPSFIVAGALHGVAKKNLTVAEVEAAVKKFLATEVS